MINIIIINIIMFMLLCHVVNCAAFCHFYFLHLTKQMENVHLK